MLNLRKKRNIERLNRDLGEFIEDWGERVKISHNYGKLDIKARAVEVWDSEKKVWRIVGGEFRYCGIYELRFDLQEEEPVFCIDIEPDNEEVLSRDGIEIPQPSSAWLNEHSDYFSGQQILVNGNYLKVRGRIKRQMLEEEKINDMLSDILGYIIRPSMGKIRGN